MNHRMRILIIGGGIAGLSAMHTLVAQQHIPLNIVLIEKHDSCGGLARSSRRVCKDSYTQYCWHVFGDEYSNIKRFMRTIDAGDGKTVDKHLIPVRVSLAPAQEELQALQAQELPLSLPLSLPWADQRKRNTTAINLPQHAARCYDLSRSWELFRFAQSSLGLWWMMKSFYRLITTPIDDLRDITWLEWINKDHLLTESQIRLTNDVWAPILGVDPLYASASSVAEIIKTNPWFSSPVPFSVLDGPSTPVWFDSWQRQIVKDSGRFNQVQFLLNHKVIGLQQRMHGMHGMHDPQLQVAVVECSNRLHEYVEYDTKNLEFDIVVLAVPPHHAAAVLPPSWLKNKLQYLANCMTLKQMSFPLLLDRRLQFRDQKTIMILPNTPWQIIIQPVFEFWLPKYLPRSADHLEIGFGNPYKPGRFCRKPWPECTLQELVDEVWREIQYAFGDEQKSGIIGVSQARPVNAQIWNDFIWKDQRWQTQDPKSSPNAGTWRLRPKFPQDIQGEFSNLYLAGDYVADQVEILNMETACISGVRAAKSVLLRLMQA